MRIRYIRNLFEYQEDFYKSVRVGTFCTSNYIEYENYGDRNKTLQLKNILVKLDHT